jgi:hypothetical protein
LCFRVSTSIRLEARNELMDGGVGGVHLRDKTRVFVSVPRCLSDFSPQDERDRLQRKYKIKSIDEGQKEEANRRQFCENRCVTRNIVLYSLTPQSVAVTIERIEKRRIGEYFHALVCVDSRWQTRSSFLKGAQHSWLFVLNDWSGRSLSYPDLW